MSKSAKRVGPIEVDPVTVDGLRIEVVHWGDELGVKQNGGYLRAVDTGSGDTVWTLQVYVTEYDERKEMDVQDVFIISLKTHPEGLEVVDELERHFVVNLVSREVAQMDP